MDTTEIYNAQELHC